MNVAAETARAYAAFAAGEYAHATNAIRSILQSHPNDPGALTLKGRLALVSGEAEEAREVFLSVLEGHPTTAAVWVDLSQSLRDLAQHKAALDAAQHAIALDGRHLLAWIRLGEIHLSLNNRGLASDAFRRALALDSRSVAAYRGLCQSEDVGPDSDVASRMRDLLSAAGIRPREVAELHYALAQVHRRAGWGEEFIRHLLAANAEQRKLCSDGRAEYQAVFDRIESAFTCESFAKLPRLDTVAPTPLFVLGMPRSGTTLAEQLLAAHPDAAAGGEMEYVRRLVQRAFEQEIGRPFPEGFDSMGAPSMNAIAQSYVRRMAIIGGDARFVTDKTPGNFHLLGLLRVLFPNGKIVHMKRDAMDTCFSILQYPFDDRSPHTCDMQLLGYVYRRYERLMDRWRDLMGDEFITIEYEQLVRSPAAEARRMYEYCGLEWRDEYLGFHRANAPVRTFSVSQVRKPIYTSSVGGWKPFADALAPLKEALDAECR